MSKFATVLKNARIANKLKQEDVAKMVGKTKNVVSNWERGENKPDIETVEILCKELNINPNDIIDWNTGAEFLFENNEKKHMEKYRSLDDHGKEAVNGILDIELSRVEKEKVAREMAKKGKEEKDKYTVEFSDELTPRRDSKSKVRRMLPVVGYASAGYPDPYVDMEPEPVPADDAPYSASFGYRLSGHSMEPRYPDKSIVWLDNTADIASGDIGVFHIDGEITCKKIYIERNRARLVPLNPEFDEVVVSEFADFRVIGKVVN